jgi:phage/plasmid primase-like uncharacterized protein
MSRLERIVAACGGILMDGGARALIPGPNHSHKDRSVSLAETEEGRILIHCFSPKDDWRDVRRALADLGLLDEETNAEPRRAGRSAPRIAAQPVDEKRIARAQRIWDDSRPLRHSAASAYLQRRAIPVLWDTPALRSHPNMTSLEDRARRPALVAAITDASGALQGVQVTLLTTHGTAKAPLATPRRVVGRLMGGVVRLHPVERELAVGEGIETMLSASAALGLPAAAALTAGNLGALIPPEGVHRLVVAVDNDAAGFAAADQLVARLTIPVEVMPPPDGAEDWNAWARERQ